MTRARFEAGLARVMRVFAKVEPHEAIGAAVLAFTSFLLLTAYYLLKTAREPLILLHGGAEVKSYAAAGQAALLLIFVQAYAAVAQRVGRNKLLATVYLFFAANLLGFAVLVRAHVSVGVPFFLWVGVFNYTAIAQFWAFAADVYRPEQGKRIFAVLGIGSSVGAVTGARIAKAIAQLGPEAMMVLAAAILVVCVALFALAGRMVERPTAPRSVGGASDAQGEPIGRESPFHLLFRDRFLLLIAALTLLLNWCNANGEYILDRTLLASLDAARAQGVTPSAFVSGFKAEYFAWVNVAGVLLQLFAVSRVVTRYGVRNALLVLPAVALLGYGLVVVAPVLALIRVAKVAENSLDYSLQNTARQALYLVATRSEKYVGKTLVDTFLVRAGDALSALGVLIASRVGLSAKALAGLNLVIVVFWTMSVLALGRAHARRTRQVAEEPVATGPSPLRRGGIASAIVLAFCMVVGRDAFAAEPSKRELPDYQGREPDRTTVGEVLLWVPRVATSPLYLTSEYVIRRPLGALVTEAERKNIPELLYDFFTFGPEHKAGFAPVAFVDFGVNPSIGVYGFWDDAFFKGNDLRAHVVGFPSAWFGSSLVERIRLDGGDMVTLRLAGMRRPDYPFFGLGPRSSGSERSRYGADTVDATTRARFRFWRASRVETGVGFHYASFYDGSYGSDPGLVENVRAGDYALPPGFSTGYEAETNHLSGALDSRRPFPEDGSGFRLEAKVDQGNGFGQMTPGAWVRWEVGAAGFVDLDGHRRVLGLSVQSSFADPVGKTSIPFTELVTLGGDNAPMPGFLPGRMIDRSAAVATLRYTWPIGPWLSGSAQAAAGNVFGEHLQGFDARLTRLSAALGFQSDGSPDSNFQFLVGFGTDPFDQGARIDSVRLSFGTTTGM